MARKGEFTNAQKRQIRDRAAGLCEVCGAPGRDADHMHALGLGGDGDMDNGRYLCRGCHSGKTRRDQKAIAKAKRIAGETRSQWNGTKPRQGKLRSRGFDKRLRKRMNGTVEKRE